MTTTDPVLAKIERAIRETEAFLELVSSEWTSQEQIDDAEMHLDIALALKSVVEKHFPLAFNEKYYCAKCKIDDRDGMVWFPCPEYKDIAEKLGVVL